MEEDATATIDERALLPTALVSILGPLFPEAAVVASSFDKFQFAPAQNDAKSNYCATDDDDDIAVLPASEDAKETADVVIVPMSSVRSNGGDDNDATSDGDLGALLKIGRVLRTLSSLSTEQRQRRLVPR